MLRKRKDDTSRSDQPGTTLDKALAKKGGLTLAQLASYDDVLTDALVDRVYFWATIRKNRARFSPSRGIQEEEVANILRDHVVIGKDPIEATNLILKLSGIRKYVVRLRTSDEKEHFQRHLRKYVNIYMPDCPFEVTTTNRYTIDTQEAAVTARKDIKKGDIIKYLSGIQVVITEEEFKQLDDVELNFSIVQSSRKKMPSLFLGPARFANHDCHANARLSTTGAHGMQIVATKAIEVGDEITVTYGTDYFGEDNSECLCATCERLRRNGWAPHTGDTDDEEEEEEREDGEEGGIQDNMQSAESLAESGSPYSPRKKRKSDALDATSPASTPRAKRQKSTPDPHSSPRQARPCGRRTFKQVKVKTEHPLSQTFNSIPAQTLGAEAHVQGQVTVAQILGPVEDIQDKRTRTLRQTSKSSETSRSSSTAASSVDSAKSPPSTAATSDDEALDRITLNVTPRKPQAQGNSILSMLDVDMKAIVTLKAVELAEESDLTSLSEFDTESQVGEATRCGKAGIRRKKLCNRELASLRQGSMERSIVSELEEARAVLTTELDITISETSRIPGDYTMTNRLLSGVHSRWVDCNTCEKKFVQDDAYQTRKECPRCERHSKVYGFAWPKTDKEGKWDDEERITDYRTVHRFVRPEEERKIKKGGRKRGLLMREAENAGRDSISKMEESVSPGRAGLRTRRTMKFTL